MSQDLDETHTTGEMKLPDSTREPESPVLVQLAGPGAVRRFDLDREVTTIGRDAEANDIVLEDPWVSRTHTQLVLDGSGARLEDQGSRNGCSVNSRAVRNIQLEDGDLIQIGQTTFKYLQPGSAEAPFYSEVFRLAFHDPVTGIYSRRYFDEALKREILRVDRQGDALSVLLIDIDRFKQFNDTLGHQAGDRVLAETARIIQNGLRGESITARYGGDEMVVLLPGSDVHEATFVAEKVRQLTESQSSIDDLEGLEVTISIGVAGSRPGRRMTAEQLLSAADGALYRAKREGRNRVAAHIDPESPDRAAEDG